jgi:mRNA interferase MazF
LATKSGRRRYVPNRGDLVWLQFDPQSGHEQAGRRPAVALSPRTYNSKSGLCLFVPVTRQIKGYPFEVVLPEDIPVEGAVLVDQLRSLDWAARQARFISELPDSLVREISNLAVLLITSK